MSSIKMLPYIIYRGFGESAHARTHTSLACRKLMWAASTKSRCRSWGIHACTLSYIYIYIICTYNGYTQRVHVNDKEDAGEERFSSASANVCVYGIRRARLFAHLYRVLISICCVHFPLATL